MAGQAAVQSGALVAGRYRIGRKLGEGGMGTVFEAHNTVTGKRVAIKWMRPELAQSSGAAGRFLREAHACSRVRHRHVIDVYDVLSDPAGLFLVMEYLEGEPLSVVLERGGVRLHQINAYVLAAMRGAGAAHKQGVIHRDIKPENIFLAREGQDGPIVPKLLDFGISKLAEPGDLRLTQTGAA